ncbi:helix-turn-helix domain-containing protein [Streptomyces actuosus]|uniref:Helix-turn-helix domain-containing protein n=1 Tax=Streptomyces actuosus TaxID=1885 RepID=A0ABS2VJ51_STRAS|nr:helix-turn-helix domain-containing protein [Streptomyces actuosus]MBN0043098.1 helix-turn-helix domain-containing protein [Streptomyces actuosus]
MEPKPWRDRLRDEEELLAQLNRLASEAADRRAQALLDGVDELGTIADVARDLGVSWNAVDKAIKKYQRKKAAGPGGTTTE